MVLGRASVGRGFVAPRYSTSARNFMRIVGGWYLRLLEGVRHIRIDNPDLLIDALQRFYTGDLRLIIAFRHVAKEDAPVMMYALNRRLQRLIRKRNRKLGRKGRIIGHAQFLYGSDVLDWAGKAAAWLFPRIGCVPVQNRGTNRNGLDILRTQVQGGTFPIALAPESQVTYHMYQCSPIAPGTASLALWGMQAAEEVLVVPVAIGYRHSDDPERFIRSMLDRWSQLSGLALEDRQATVLSLLHEATEKTVGLLEEMYGIMRDTEATLRRRILDVCEVAMMEAEALAHVEAQGNLLDRLFRIRYRGYDAVHPQAFDPKDLPPVGRSVADFHALEAHVYLRHSQLVDVLQYIDPAYIVAPCSTGRACEYVLNLLDVLNRIQGGNINTRYSPREKRALVSIGEPVAVSSVAGEGKHSRKAHLNALSDAVQTALQHTSVSMEERWERGKFDA